MLGQPRRDLGTATDSRATGSRTRLNSAPSVDQVREHVRHERRRESDHAWSSLMTPPGCSGSQSASRCDERVAFGRGQCRWRHCRERQGAAQMTIKIRRLNTAPSRSRLGASGPHTSPSLRWGPGGVNHNRRERSADRPRPAVSTSGGAVRRRRSASNVRWRSIRIPGVARG